MAEQLKHILNRQAVDWLAEIIAANLAGFRRGAFAAACLDGLDELELMPRGQHIADVMGEFLPGSFPEAALVLAGSLGPEISETGESGVAAFWYLPHALYVRKFGIGDFGAAMDFQYALTKRFTAEFTIRAFIERYPDESYQRLLIWAGDPNTHIRRLVSEGTRPRLPWAARLRAFQTDPSPVIALLELLKDDPSLYVRRSVANNLNDIGKDHPLTLIDICRRWLKDAPEPRRWIVNHALRSLIKAGNRDALTLLGHGAEPVIAVSGVHFESGNVKLGEVFRFSCEMTNAGSQTQDLLADFAVHFVKANGKTAPKVFKLKKISLLAGQTVPLAASVSFRDLTTRKHFPGRHKIDLLVNGRTFPLLEFDVAREQAK